MRPLRAGYDRCHARALFRLSCCEWNPRAMSAALLELQHVSKTFTRGGLFSSRRIVAVNDVSFQINAEKPEIFTIIGESGSGKATLSRMILNIERPSSGALVFDGIDLATVRSGADRMAFMHKAQ